MKLRNKKTGEIREINNILIDNMFTIHSLAELNEEWEDVPEEPKEYWIIDTILHEIRFLPYKNNEEDKRYEQWLEELGLKFETEEEAEKAVEKLRAWKRLKDKGFRFDGWKCTGSISFTFDNYCGDGQPMSASDYLDLLFSGEDD